MTVLDTTILIDHLRGLEAARGYLRSLREAPRCSEITRAELLQGLRDDEGDAAGALCTVLEWAAVDERISRRAGELGRRYRRTHPGLGVADLIIAATAMESDEPLATSNIRHFPMFRGIRAPY